MLCFKIRHNKLNAIAHFFCADETSLDYHLCQSSIL